MLQRINLSGSPVPSSILFSGMLLLLCVFRYCIVLVSPLIDFLSPRLAGGAASKLDRMVVSSAVGSDWAEK